MILVCKKYKMWCDAIDQIFNKLTLQQFLRCCSNENYLTNPHIHTLLHEDLIVCEI